MNTALTPGPFLGELLEDAVRALRGAGIDGARLDARTIAGHAFGLEAAQVLARRDNRMETEHVRQFSNMIARRTAREPMAHILGEREFWSLRFEVSSDTLIPRPDTETLVQAAVDWAKVRGSGRNLKVLDLGTGTGCILLALLSEWPEATGVGVDISPRALEIARTNARELDMEGRVSFVEGDWGTGLRGTFDVIVSNPPYIPERDLAGLQPEVSRFEPIKALVGGSDGLDAYRAISPQISKLLGDGAAAATFLEIGIGQLDAVSGILRAAGLEVFETHRDLGGIVRCLTVTRTTIRDC